MLTVTVEPEIRERIDAVVEAMPGSTLSGLVEQLLLASLPAFEQVAVAVQASRDEAGVVDEAAATEHMANWVGRQLLKLASGPDALYNTTGGGRSVGNSE